MDFPLEIFRFVINSYFLSFCGLFVQRLTQITTDQEIPYSDPAMLTISNTRPPPAAQQSPD